MYCTTCGKVIENAWLACPSCGAKTNPALLTAPGAPKPLNTQGTLYDQTSAGIPTPLATSESNGKKNSLWITIASIALALIALNGFGAFNGLTGQVTLDSSRVENEIETGIYDQSGYSVVASCPSPMAGKVGETRSCSVEDETGTNYIVDVTIQNKNGDVVWVVRT